MLTKRLAVLGILLLIAGPACAIGSGGGTPEAGAPGTEPASAGAPGSSEDVMLPVSINEGLASLDSYRMVFVSDVLDSVAGEQTVVTTVMEENRATDAKYNRTENLVTSADGEVISEEVQEQYFIGNQICSLSEGAGEITALSDSARVMSDLMSQVVVIEALIENQVFVGEEVVNAVPARMYTFEITSLGAATDVEVARSDGSYAVAVDGNYLITYRLDLDLRTGPEGDPEAEATVSSFDFSLESINQPVEIEFPAECQAVEGSGS